MLSRKLALPLLFAAAPFATIALAATVTLITPQCSMAGTPLPSSVSPSGWITVGATIDPTYSGGADPQYYNTGLSYAELGATPGYPNYVGGLIAKTLGIKGGQYGLPGGFPLLARPVGSNSPGIRILKSDIGSGQAGDLHHVIDLHPRIGQLLNFDGKQDIQIKAAGNNPGADPSAELAGEATATAACRSPPPTASTRPTTSRNALNI